MPVPKGFRPPNAGKGRVKGVPNKLSGDVRAMILKALDEVGGHAYLVEQAKKNPNAFLALVGKILPRDEFGNGRAFPASRGSVNLSVTFVNPRDRYADTKLIDVTPVEPASSFAETSED